MSVFVIFAGFVVVFPILWVLIGFIIANVGGWQALRGSYRYDGEFPMHIMRFQSIRMGLANYNNVITVGFDDNYLYLKTWWLFKIAHHPLRIPYTDIAGREKTFLGFNYVKMNFADAPSISIRFSRKVTDLIAEKIMAKDER